MSIINENIRRAVEDISIVDTHEHILPEGERDLYAVDFGYLFGHYNTSDLVSAGMPAQLMETARLPMHQYRKVFVKRMKLRRNIAEPERKDMSLTERWQALEPHWNAIRNTAYAKQTIIAIKDIFGFDDLNKDTYEPLSMAIAKSRRSHWYRYILKEKGNIAISILDAQISKPDRELFAPVMRLDHFIAVKSRGELNDLEQESGISINSLDDLVKAMHQTLEKYMKGGICGIKNGLAYERTLKYEKVAKSEAEPIFNRIASHLGEGTSWLEAKPLQDYMMHQIIRPSVPIMMRHRPL